MKVEIKNLHRGQVIYDSDVNDDYTVYSLPQLVNGKWLVEVTTRGEYAWTFTEDDTLWDSEDRKD